MSSAPIRNIHAIRGKKTLRLCAFARATSAGDRRDHALHVNL